MKNYIEFPLESGGKVVFEIDEAEDLTEKGGLVQVSRGSNKIFAQADKTFDAAVENVKKTADVLLKKLRSSHESPNEIEITFGLKATGELGGSIFVAKGSLEANYVVKVKWSKEKEADTR